MASFAVVLHLCFFFALAERKKETQMNRRYHAAAGYKCLCLSPPFENNASPLSIKCEASRITHQFIVRGLCPWVQYPELGALIPKIAQVHQRSLIERAV
jgi:hypothetical protein